MEQNAHTYADTLFAHCRLGWKLPYAKNFERNPLFLPFLCVHTRCTFSFSEREQRLVIESLHCTEEPQVTWRQALFPSAGPILNALIILSREVCWMDDTPYGVMWRGSVVPIIPSHTCTHTCTHVHTHKRFALGLVETRHLLFFRTHHVNSVH